MDKSKLAPVLFIAGIVVVAAAIVLAVGRPNQTPSETGGSQNRQPTTPAAGSGSQQTSRPQEQPAPSGPQTTVPDGMGLDAYVQKYYDAVVKKDWQTAYDLQPASEKASTDLNAFKQNMEGYGILNPQVGSADIQGDNATVTVNYDLAQGMKWQKVWTFQKKDGKWQVISAKSGSFQ